MSYLDQVLADSKITEEKKKEYVWLGERLFEWKYLLAVGAWIDKEGRTASEGAALRWMRSPSGIEEVFEAMNNKGFFLTYEQYATFLGGRKTGHRAGFRKTFKHREIWAYGVSFVEVVLDAAYLALKEEHGEAAEL